MTTEITNIDWFLDKENYEGTVSFKGKNGAIIKAFSHGTKFKIGEKIKIELDSINSELEWEVIFSENRRKEIKLIEKSNWEYRAYGKILDINPVIINFGEFELNTENWSNDKNIIGEYVYWEINRLDLYKIENDL